MTYAVCPHCGGEGGYTDDQGYFTPACSVCHGSGALPWFSRHAEPSPAPSEGAVTDSQPITEEQMTDAMQAGSGGAV